MGLVAWGGAVSNGGELARSILGPFFSFVLAMEVASTRRNASSPFPMRIHH
jgi:hypothetical protein